LRDNGLPGSDTLREAMDQMRSIRSGKDDNSILTFNTAHRELKEAIKRSSELVLALTESRIQDLRHAKQILSIAWNFLSGETDIGEALQSQASTLKDTLTRETIFRDLAAIDQHARAIELEYSHRLDSETIACRRVYDKAMLELHQTPGWNSLEEETRKSISSQLSGGMNRSEAAQSIPFLRSERDACPSRLAQAIQKVHQTIEGDRLATIRVGSYFSGGIETEEQLDAALAGIREECLPLIGAGKKVVIS
jgi:hypothetical protein